MAQIRKCETDQNGLDNLRLTTGPMPEISEEHVLVKINAVSLNYRDTEGNPALPPPPSPSPPQPL